MISDFMDNESMTIFAGLAITVGLGLPLSALNIFPLAFPLLTTLFITYIFAYLFVTDWRESRHHHHSPQI